MENVLEPKEAFNLFKVPSKLENIITALMVSIISNDKKRMNEAFKHSTNPLKSSFLMYSFNKLVLCLFQLLKI